MQELTLNYYFNNKINIPSNIKIIKLGYYNINLIDYLPDNIEELNLEYYCNLKLINLPSSIKIIKNIKYSNRLYNPKKCIIIYNND